MATGETSRRRPSVDEGALAEFVHRIAGADAAWERTERGVSTPVYRIRHGGTTLYLRLGEDEGFSMAPEAHLHRALTAHGLRVPEVVHFEPFDAGLRRSALLITEIPGEPLGDAAPTGDKPSIVREAGRELAHINAIEVEGFGWVRRDEDRWPLRGELATWPEFALGGLEAAMERASGLWLNPAECAEVERLGAMLAARPYTSACLAHGDFDVSHIYSDEGRFTGIIDFGEIRGAEPHYDLAHFLLHDTETADEPLFEHLREGWEDERGETVDAEAVRTSAILIGVRQMDRWLGRWGPEALGNPHVARMAVRVRELLGAG